MSSNDPIQWHGTTILCDRKGGEVVIAGDTRFEIELVAR